MYPTISSRARQFHRHLYNSDHNSPISRSGSAPGLPIRLIEYLEQLVSVIVLASESPGTPGKRLMIQAFISHFATDKAMNLGKTNEIWLVDINYQSST
jgi:hypothetical protein